jgi:hypothetical protein
MDIRIGSFRADVHLSSVFLRIPGSASSSPVPPHGVAFSPWRECIRPAQVMPFSRAA